MSWPSYGRGSIPRRYPLSGILMMSIGERISRFSSCVLISVGSEILCSCTSFSGTFSVFFENMFAAITVTIRTTNSPMTNLGFREKHLEPNIG